MAKMHPEKSPPNATESERTFFNACSSLPEKYHVFYSLRWHTTDERTGRREDSECDFLIYNPDYGYLCIEVKGGSRIEVDGDKWILYDAPPLKRSPYIQAEQGTRFIKKYFEDETEASFGGVYGYAVAFPRFNVDSPLSVSSPLELTICLRDMQGDFHKRITDIFKYFKSVGGQATYLSQSNKDKFISVIKKRVVLSIAAGSLIHHKERELIEINKIQDAIIDCLTNYNKAFIIGGAGTGKTWIGIKKIKRAVADNQKALFLCYNKALAEYVKMQVGNDADCYTFDAFACKLLKADADTAPVQKGQKEYFDLLDKAVNAPKYDLIVVDEAQDFSEDWAASTNLFLVDANYSSLYVFYDESQNIFNRDFGDKFFIDTKPYILRYNIRNTAQIYKWTTENTREGQDTIPNEIEGAVPEERSFTSKSKMIAYLNSILNRLIDKEGVSPKSIVILSNLKKENSILCGTDMLGKYTLCEGTVPAGDNIAFRTIQGFKGLESDIVVYINESIRGVPQAAKHSATLYTAYTRAKYFLYIVNFVKEYGDEQHG